MKYKYLNYKEVYNEKDKKILKMLYNSFLGRNILKVVTNSLFSKLLSKLFNSRISSVYIGKFIKNNNIDIKKYKDKQYNSFNDFFIRELKTINKDSKFFEYISTAECKLSCFRISDELIINVKNSMYSIKELIQNEEISKKYNGGLCLIFRLAPNNYHRYIFVDSGTQEKIKKIKGKLHTVNPIIYDKYKVFVENTREVSILKTKNFGDITQIEVGALCVGKIKNNSKNKFDRYEEKGFFEFGGSTIIQLIEKDKINIKQEIMDNTCNNIETFVDIGQVIGEKI